LNYGAGMTAKIGKIGIKCGYEGLK